jgi:hypothetical protein
MKEEEEECPVNIYRRKKESKPYSYSIEDQSTSIERVLKAKTTHSTFLFKKNNKYRFTNAI